MRKILHIPINRKVPPSLPTPVLTGFYAWQAGSQLNQQVQRLFKLKRKIIRVKKRMSRIVLITSHNHSIRRFMASIG